MTVLSVAAFAAVLAAAVFSLPPELLAVLGIAVPYLSNLLVKQDEFAHNENNHIRAALLLLGTVVLAMLKVVAEPAGFTIAALVGAVTETGVFSVASFQFLFKNKKLGTDSGGILGSARRRPMPPAEPELAPKPTGAFTEALDAADALEAERTEETGRWGPVTDDKSHDASGAEFFRAMMKVPQ